MVQSVWSKLRIPALFAFIEPANTDLYITRLLTPSHVTLFRTILPALPILCNMLSSRWLSLIHARCVEPWHGSCSGIAGACELSPTVHRSPNYFPAKRRPRWQDEIDV